MLRNQTYFRYDGLGSTAGLTDGSGNVTASYGYDVFGELRSGSPGASLIAARSAWAKLSRSTGYMSAGPVWACRQRLTFPYLATVVPTPTNRIASPRSATRLLRQRPPFGNSLSEADRTLHYKAPSAYNVCGRFPALGSGPRRLGVHLGAKG